MRMSKQHCRQYSATTKILLQRLTRAKETDTAEATKKEANADTIKTALKAVGYLACAIWILLSLLFHGFDFLLHGSGGRRKNQLHEAKRIATLLLLKQDMRICCCPDRNVSYHDSGKNTREHRVLERSMIPLDTACGIALVLALQKSTVVQSSFHEKNLSIKLQMLLDCNLSDSSARVSIYT